MPQPKKPEYKPERKEVKVESKESLIKLVKEEEVPLTQNKKPHRNHYLFSDHFIDTRLKDTKEWQACAAHKEAFKRLRELYEHKKNILSELKEAQTEEEFIKPVLEILNFSYVVQTPAKKAKKINFPDYSLFSNEATKEKAYSKLKQQPKEFYNQAVAIADAKHWDRALDSSKRSLKDTFYFGNPAYQIEKYLVATGVTWGILTNGRLWQLYNRNVVSPLEKYYEVDLVQLLEIGDLEHFKFFWLFFNRDAFVKPSSEMPTFLDKILIESIEYASDIGDKLKDKVYDAVVELAKGFVKYKAKADYTKGELKEIYDNCLIFLYRLLFIFYAESRELLPVHNPGYHRYSTDKLKREVAQALDRNEELSEISDNYWNDLSALFRMIDRGDEPIGVPPYNGGLFNEDLHSFLIKNRVADKYLASSIDFIARVTDKDTGEKVFIDYKGLEIRHLGTIYEGLLEFHLEIAKEDLVAVKEKGREKYISTVTAEDKKISRKITKGELYLVNDKGERKATGSYYTPDYIVQYIIENTLGPLVKGKTADEILELTILDPAMGSGHFLVAAVDFLAKELLARSTEQSDEEYQEREELIFLKRLVVEKCIYGVDLNPLAVELAKLSLWLSSIAKGKPLSFLEHHLKCGNSLIGVQLENLKVLPKIKEEKKKSKETQDLPAPINKSALTQDIGLSVKDYHLIEEMSSDQLEAIREKGRILENIKKRRLEKWFKIADLWTSKYFGIELYSGAYHHLCNSILSKDSKTLRRWTDKFLEPVENIAKKKRFFHWELEFPEIFFDEYGREKDDPGFDAVVGNPPYVSVKVLTKPDKNYYLGTFKSANGQFDLYGLFIEQGIKYSKSGFGFITSNTFLENVGFKQLRVFILQECTIKKLIDFGETVFKDANLDVMVSIFEKERNQEKRTNNKVKIALDSLEKFKSEQNFKVITQKLFSDFPASQFKIKLTEELILFFKKIEYSSEKLGNFLNLNRGIETGSNDSRISTNKLSPEHREILVGEDVGRYQINFASRYIPFDRNDLANFKDERMYLQPKIFIQRIRNLSLDRRLVATFDDSNYFALNTLRIGTLKDGVKNYSLLFLLSVLNSNLINYYFKKLFHNKDIYAYQLGQIPICRISFTTLQIKHKKLFEKAKELYETYLETNNWDSISLFVQQRLSAKPEESDVIHDFLAYLAKQMIEYNKEKSKEVKSFLKWLEREIGVEIKNLSNKTAIKKYYEDDVEKLLKILKQNKKRLKIDPNRREFQEKISAEFTKSIAKLAPLNQKITATDKLIDQTVYKLYEITNEEQKIIEEKA